MSSFLQTNRRFYQENVQKYPLTISVFEGEATWPLSPRRSIFDCYYRFMSIFSKIESDIINFRADGANGLFYTTDAARLFVAECRGHVKMRPNL